MIKASNQKLKTTSASYRTRTPLKSRKKKNRSQSPKHSKLTYLDTIREKLKPSFKAFNYHYNLWGSKLDMIVFVSIILSIPTGYFGTFLTPILLYYTYVVLLVCFRIFMHWDFFYMVCRMIALKIELGLTKGKGFHNEFEVKNVRKD